MGSMSHLKISSSVIIWLMVLFGLLYAQTTPAGKKAQVSLEESESKDAKLDLEKAETKDAQKLEIIKQIRKLNNDGSYTVGYEADDGTFKIESRDVLGNIKGTYGYVDGNGEIKRVSYTANNGTSGLKNVTEKPENEEVVHIPRQNRTGLPVLTTRRPASLSYLTSTASSVTRPTVIQAIPKRKPYTSGERPSFSSKYSSLRANDFTTAAPRKGEPTTTVVYAQSLPSKQSIINIRPTLLPGSFKTVEQISRPDKLEINEPVSKVQISSHRDTSTSKPVTEDFDDKDTERKNVRGNFLRRQLSEDAEENFETQQQIIYGQSSGDDTSHIYGGVTGTARPLFTTSSPRIPSLVLAARSRAAQVQNLIHSNQQTTSTTEKVYVKPPRRRTESNDDNERTTESTSEHNYLTQGPVTVQIPPNRDVSQATEDDKRVYRRPVAYRNREFVRQAPPPPPDIDYNGPRQFRIPIPHVYPPPQYQQQGISPGYSGPSSAEHEQYLRETTSPSQKGPGVAATQAPFAGDSNAPEGGPYGPPRGRQYLPQGRPMTDAGYEQQSQPIPFAPNPYSPYNRPPPPSQYYMNPDRPLTARDFERLLNLLIYRHQQPQRYNYFQQPNPYYGGIGGGGYNPYGPPYGYQQQIPRPPPLYNQYDPRYGRPPAPYAQFSDQDQMYQQPDGQVPYAGQRLIPRRKQVGPQYFGAQSVGYPERPEYQDASQVQQNEYLPSNVREELLYRMLLLAMQPGDAQASEPDPSSPEYAPTDTAAATTTTVSAMKFRKPIRSVQILGEE